MSSNYRIDYTREIAYILKHFSELKMTDKELETLQETLTFVKWQVEEQIVQEIVRENKELSNQIEQAQDKLKSRLEELERKNEQKNPLEKGLLEEIVKEMDSIKELIGTPDDVIAHFLKQWKESSKLDLKHGARYNNLINICATNMAYGYMSMEHVGSGNKTTSTGIELFSHDKKKDAFTGYTPNPKAISAFLKLIRDPASIEAFRRHEMAFRAVELLNGRSSKVKEELSKAELLNRALIQKKNLCEDVEKYFKQLAELNEKKEELSKQISELTLPHKANAFMRLIYKILGTARRQESKFQNLTSQVEKLQGEINNLILHENAERVKNSLDYAAVYEAYKEAVEDNLDSEDKSTVEIESKLAEHLKSHESNMHEYVVDKIKPQERLDNAKKQEEAVSIELNKKLQTLSKIYNSLTKEQKQLIDKNPNGFISVEGIKSRYVVFNMENTERRYGVSPFVSSLIIETLMKLDNIHTVEDAKKFGLTISQVDLANFREKAAKIEKAIEKNLTTLSGDKVITETEQDTDDDGRE